MDKQSEMEKIIASLSSRRPRLLLHSCCAPCSSAVLERLAPHFELTVFYFNPNISSAAEYEKRLAEQRRFISETYGASIGPIEGAYSCDGWREAVKGLEAEPERGARCAVCFDMRLRETARTAAAGGFEFFTTTLTLSPHKDAELLNRLGDEAGAMSGVSFLPSDFKKKGGYQRSIELSRRCGLYRQNYCGCVFSQR